MAPVRYLRGVRYPRERGRGRKKKCKRFVAARGVRSRMGFEQTRMRLFAAERVEGGCEGHGVRTEKNKAIVGGTCRQGLKRHQCRRQIYQTVQTKNVVRFLNPYPPFRVRRSSSTAERLIRNGPQWFFVCIWFVLLLVVFFVCFVVLEKDRVLRTLTTVRYFSVLFYLSITLTLSGSEVWLGFLNRFLYVFTNWGDFSDPERVEHTRNGRNSPKLDRRWQRRLISVVPVIPVIIIHLLIGCRFRLIRFLQFFSKSVFVVYFPLFLLWPLPVIHTFTD